MITYEEKEFCKVLVDYQAPIDVVKQKREQALEEIYKQSKSVAIKGFRKGKANMNAVKMHFHKQISDVTKQKLLSHALDEYVFESKAKTIFYPEIKSVQLNDNQFHCQMLVMKKPSFELKQYKGFEIPRPHLEMTAPAMVEKALQQLRTEHGDVQPYREGEFVQVGDKVTLDMKCVAGDKVIEEFTKEGVLYEVGSGLYQDIDDNILGMIPGEERVFETLFDKEAGTKATFTVLVHMGVKSIPCSLDDDFAQKLGIETFDKLRHQLDGQAVQEMKNQEQKAIEQQIVQRLLAEHSFEVPQFLLDVESEKIAAQFNVKFANLDETVRNNIRVRAKDMVKLSMIMDSIRETEQETSFSESEMLNYMRNQWRAAGTDPEKMIVEAEKSGQLYGIVASLQHKATMEWLANNSKIID